MTSNSDTDIPMFMDLQKTLTTDPVFIEKVMKLMQKWKEACDEGDNDAARKAMDEVLHTCHFNPSLFVPYFFPKYPDSKPMTLWDYPHAMSMMAFIPNGTLTVQASRQIGKCLAGDTDITVYDVDGNEKSTTMEALFNKYIDIT